MSRNRKRRDEEEIQSTNIDNNSSNSNTQRSSTPIRDYLSGRNNTSTGRSSSTTRETGSSNGSSSPLRDMISANASTARQQRASMEERRSTNPYSESAPTAWQSSVRRRGNDAFTGTGEVNQSRTATPGSMGRLQTIEERAIDLAENPYANALEDYGIYTRRNGQQNIAASLPRTISTQEQRDRQERRALLNENSAYITRPQRTNDIELDPEVIREQANRANSRDPQVRSEYRDEVNALRTENRDEYQALMDRRGEVIYDNFIDSVRNADDFNEHNQFEANGNNEMYQDTYYAINHPAGHVLESTKDEYNYLTPEEIETANYIHYAKGADEMERYLSTLNLSQRSTEAKVEEEQWFAENHPGWAGYESIALAPLKGAGYYEDMYNNFMGNDIDIYSDAHLASNIQSGIRDYQLEQLANNSSSDFEAAAKQFVYSTGMSMGDFLITTGVTGGNEALSLAIMGSGAAQDSAINAVERGLPQDQALMTATVAGAAEILTEKISIEALFGESDDAIRYMIKNVLSEGSEEVGSDIINLLADTIINGDKSEFNEDVKAYEADGYTHDEAVGMAIGNQANTMLMDFAGGAVSGGVMGGGALSTRAVTNNINNRQNRQSTQLGNGLNNSDSEVRNTIIEEGLNSNNAEVRQIAELAQNNEASDKQMGILARAVASSKSIYNTISNFIQSKGISEETANNYTSSIIKYLNGSEMTQMDNMVMDSNIGQTVVNEIQSGTFDEAYNQSQAINDALNIAKGNRKTALSNVVDTVKNVVKPNTNTTTNTTTNTAENTNEETKTETQEAESNSSADNKPSLSEISYIRDAMNQAQKEYESKTDVKSDDIVSINRENGKTTLELKNGETVEADNVRDRSIEQLSNIASVTFENDAEAAAQFVKDYNKNVNVDVYTSIANTMMNKAQTAVSYSDAVSSLNKVQQYYVSSGVVPHSFLQNMYSYGQRVANQRSKAFNSDIARENQRLMYEALGLEWSNADIDEANAMLKGKTAVFSESAQQSRSESGAHETTHLIKKYAPEAYQKLEDHILQTFKDNGVYDQLYKNKAKQYESDNVDLIHEEMIASACQEFFNNEDFIKKVCKTQPNVAQKIINTLREALAEIKKAIKNYTPGTLESNELKKVETAYQKAMDLYIEGLKETRNTLENETNSAKDGTSYSKKELSYQLDDVLKGNQKENDYVNFGYTPSVLNNEFGFKNYKVLMRPSHAYSIMVSEAKAIQDGRYKANTNYHNLGKNRMQTLLPSINNAPLFIKSNTNSNNSDLVIVTNMVDKNNEIIIIAIKPNDNGSLVCKPVNTNRIKSAYGKNTIGYYIKKAYNENRILKANEKNSQQLKNPRFQLPNTLFSDDYSNNIASYVNSVNSKNNAIANIKKSLKNSNGSTLTEAQAEYFKDSKIRDNEGNLLVVYHGTPTGGFTVFKNDLNFFTANENYANGYQNPSASARVTGKNKTNAMTYEGYLNMTKPFDISDPDIRKIFVDEYIKGGWAQGINPYISDAEINNQIKNGIDWVEADNLKEFFDEEGYDYDGIILNEGGFFGEDGKVVNRGTSYVTFNSNQFKNIDNENPTANEDIRFSLKQPIEQTKDLIAVHNLTEDKFMKTLQLGGFPMPSIAVTKANMGWKNFGNISILFGANTINPSVNKKNKVYGADAWTPVVPRIEYEVDYNAWRKLEDSIRSNMDNVPEFSKRGVENFISNLNYNMDSIGGVDGAIERYANDPDVINYYLSTQGKAITDIVTKETRTTMKEGEIEEAQRFIDEFGSEISNIARMSGRDSMNQYGDRIKKVLAEYYAEADNGNIDFGYEVVNSMKGLDIIREVRKARDFFENGAEQVKTEEDIHATNNKIREAVDLDAYKKWLRDSVTPLIANTGIYNGKDIFTPSGNRRSFNQTHMSYTAENIVKAMMTKDQRFDSAFFNGIKGIRSVAAEDFKSLQEIRNKKDKLNNISEDEFNQMNDDLDQRLSKVMNKILSDSKTNYDFGDMDNLGTAIIEACEKPTTENIQKVLNGYTWKVSSENLVELYDIIHTAANMPVNMFEAKPQRVVDFSEIKATIIPDNASQEFIDMLNERNIPYETYEAGNEDDRLAKLNAHEEVRFSKKNYASMSNTEINTAYNELIKSKDMAAVKDMVKEYAEYKLSDSKARLKDGSLREFYHGTNSDAFNVFDMDMLGTGSGDTGFFGKGFYFAFDEFEAKTYGSNIKKAYLDTKNPYYIAPLYQYDGKTPNNSFADRAVFLMNFKEEFPDLFNNLQNKDDMRLFIEDFKEIYDTVDFEVKEETNEYGEKEYWVYAGKTTKSFTNSEGETFSWDEYEYNKLFVSREAAENKLDNAFFYYDKLNGRPNLPSPRDVIMESDFSGDLQKKGYDSIFQSEEGDEVVLFKSSQIKNSDAITYDDNGNIIPLSERFNTADDDIRYSKKQLSDDLRLSTKIDDLWDSLVEEEYEDYLKTDEGGIIVDSASILQEGFEALKNLERVGGANFTKNKAKQIAKTYIQQYGSTYGVDNLADNIMSVYAYIQQNDVNYADMIRVMKEVAKPILEYSKGNEEYIRQTKPFRDYVKSLTISLDAKQKSEVVYTYGSMENFRRATKGRINIKESGKNIDQLWNEIVAESGNMLDINEGSSTQIIALADLINDMNDGMSIYDTRSNEQSAYDIALNIYTDFFKNIKADDANITEVKQRIAENVKAYEAAVDLRYTEMVKQIQDAKNQELEYIKKQYQQRLEEYKQSRELSVDEELQLETMRTRIARLESDLVKEQKLNELNEKLLKEQQKAVKEDHATERNKYYEKEKELKAEQRAKLAEVRAQRDAAIAQIKAERDKAVLDARYTRDKALANARASRLKAAESRRMTQTRNQIKKIVDDLNTAMLNPTDNKHIPAKLINSTIDVLNAIDLNTGRSEALAERLAKLKDQYELVKSGYGEGDVNPDYDEDTYAKISRLKQLFENKSIAKLTEDELNEVLDICKAVRSQVRNENRLIKSAIKEEVSEAGENIVKEVMATKGEGRGKLAELSNRYINTSLNADRFFRRIVDYKDDSTLLTLANELNEGSHKQLQIKMDVNDIFKSVTEGKQNQKDLYKLTGENMKDWIDTPFTDENGNTLRVPAGMRVSLAMHLMNGSNMRHIIHGGLTIPDAKAYHSGNMADAYGKYGHTVQLIDYSAFGKIKETLADESLTVEERENLLRRYRDQVALAEKDAYLKLSDWVKGMTSYEQRVLNAAKEYFHNYSGKTINETSVALNGYTKARTQKYFPIKTDKNFTATDIEGIKRDATLEGWGNLKSRTFGGNPIVLEDVMNVVNGHSDFLSKYAGLAIPIRNFNKIYKVTLPYHTNSVKKAISLKWGSKAQTWIENLMTDLQTNRTRTDAFSKAMNKLRGNFAQATLASNISVAMKQAASYPTAAYSLGWDAIGAALASKNGVDLFTTFATPMWLKGSTKKTMELARQYTPLLDYRNQGNSTQELGDLKNQRTIFDQIPVANKVVRGMTNWIQNIDTTTVATLWKAAEFRVSKDNKNLKKGTEAYYEEVARVFNKAVEDTQPNYTVMQRPDILRTDNEFLKQVFMFKTQPLQNLGIVVDATGNMIAKLNDKTATKAQKSQAIAEFSRAISSQIVAAVVFSGMTLAANAFMHRMNRYRDDDDEITKEAILKRFINDVGSCLAGALPLGSEVYDYIQAKITGSNYYGIEVSTVEMVNDFVENFDKLYGALNAEDGIDMAEVKKYAEKLIINSGTIAGVPLNNVKNLLNGFILHAEDYKNDEFGSFEAGVDRSNKVEYHRWFEAIQNGDDEKANEILDELMTRFENKDSNLYDSSNLGGYIVDMYNEGLIDRDEAEELLVEIGKPEADAHWYMQKIEDPEDTKMYNNIIEALEDGDVRDIKDAIDELNEYGTDSDAILRSSDVKKSIKAAVLNGDLDREDAVEILEYLGLDAEEAEEKVEGYFSSQTSSERSELKEQYLDGSVNRADAEAQLIESGLDENEAHWKVVEWETGSSSEYVNLYTAIENHDNSAVQAAVKELDQYGHPTDEQNWSCITTYFKPIYRELYATNRTEAASLKNQLLLFYTSVGKDWDKKSKDIDAWLED